jgi:D-alanyl-D-alanine carboxypeptidase (penicillin-binding protein 5/6)
VLLGIVPEGPGRRLGPARGRSHRTQRPGSGRPRHPKGACDLAKAAILIDPESERILFSRKANDRLPMASTTKIMTALVVLERLPLDARVTASLKASETIGSGMELKEGETFTVEELLNALLVLSANDAAVALAEATAGSVGAFAELMNAKAKELGLKNSHFVNPHGMTAKGHYSSAFDLAHIAAAALADHTFRTIVDTRSYTLNRPDGTTTTFTNSNKLLEQVGWVTGVKTGSTPRAGRCLVASGTRDGRTLISVVLGTEHSTIASKECLELLEYGFAHYRRAVVAVRGERVTDVPIPAALGSRLDLVAGRTLAVSVYADDEVTSTIRVRSDMGLPISKGEVLGTLTAKVNGGEIATIDLLPLTPSNNPPSRTCASACAAAGLPACSSRLRRSHSGRETARPRRPPRASTRDCPPTMSTPRCKRNAGPSCTTTCGA